MSDAENRSAFADVTEADVRAVFDEQSYVAGDDIVTTVLLALRLGKPLLVEGEPGGGKTELAKVLAAGFGSELVRLQCYEGLAAENALYEWNYTKQLLAVQAQGDSLAAGDGAAPGTDGDGTTPGSGGGDGTAPGTDGDGTTPGSGGGDGTAPGTDGDGTPPGSGGDPGSVFDEEYLFERPLLRALRADGEKPPVLLIDEVDRADEEFEALLLEVLSDFQVSVPELGTVSAELPPVVVITSNRTRGLSDALKRRCLYLHVEPPTFEKERAILERKVPELDGAVAAELCGMTSRLREEPFVKQPGAAETLDWARAVAQLRADGSDEPISVAEVRNTLGCLLKEVQDVERVDDELLSELLSAAEAARAEGEG